MRALISLADKIHPEARHSIAWLRRLGVEPYIVTGDVPAVAQAVAEELGIPSNNVQACAGRGHE